MDPIKTRHSFIDNAKAIAILLVVIGHTDGIQSYFKIFIYSFHIPAFYFLSGYLARENKLKMKFRNYAASQLKSLVVPYVIFGLTSLVYAVLNKALKGGNMNI